MLVGSMVDSAFHPADSKKWVPRIPGDIVINPFVPNAPFLYPLKT